MTQLLVVIDKYGGDVVKFAGGMNLCSFIDMELILIRCNHDCVALQDYRNGIAVAIMSKVTCCCNYQILMLNRCALELAKLEWKETHKSTIDFHVHLRIK